MSEHGELGDCAALDSGSCFECCDRCNYDTHTCHFCGEQLDHHGNAYRYDSETGVTTKRRHWLSDCRPDLVAHEPGPLCTWKHVEVDGKVYQTAGCYAYQDRDTNEWGTEHKHFYEDGRTG